MFMKFNIVKGLYIAHCDKCGAEPAAFSHKCPQDVAPGLSTGDRELVFTALVSKEGFNFRIEGGTNLQCGSRLDLICAFDRLCEIISLKTGKDPLSVTLKIEPVNVPAKVDTASGGMDGHE